MSGRGLAGPLGQLQLAIALALFLSALRLQFGFAEAMDVRHSVEPQNLSDCRAPLRIAPVSGGEKNRLPRGVLYINQVAADTFVGHGKNYVLPPTRFLLDYSKISRELFPILQFGIGHPSASAPYELLRNPGCKIATVRNRERTLQLSDLIASRRATATQAGMCDRGCRLVPLRPRAPHRHSRGYISNESPGVAVGYHVGPEVAAINMANSDSATVAIERSRFAGDAFANQCAQVFGCCASGGPSIGARLDRLRRVDSPKAIGYAIDLERIAVNHAGRLSEGGRGNERGTRPGPTVSSVLASARLGQESGGVLQPRLGAGRTTCLAGLSSR